jgi:hypothetical protein
MNIPAPLTRTLPLPYFQPKNDSTTPHSTKQMNLEPVLKELGREIDAKMDTTRPKKEPCFSLLK